jgi:hypothetical protein
MPVHGTYAYAFAFAYAYAYVCTLQGGGSLREGEDLEEGDQTELLSDGMAAALQALPPPARTSRTPRAY